MFGQGLNFGGLTGTAALNIDFLVVAGGGGGGAYNGGGGGAGGYKTTTTYSGSETPLVGILGTAYDVTVGAGGNGQVSNTQSVNGSSSTFSSIVSTGGGAGGGYTGSFYNGSTGGSGGGAAYAASSPGAGTTNQGFAGGNGDGGTNSGGGGGAGAVGQNGSSTKGGNGGSGVTLSITGSNVGYAGGGAGAGYPAGGGSGGTGSDGGGNGGANSTGTNGTLNTGGGGGGSQDTASPPNYAGGSGGSGTVILRYPTAAVSSFAVTGTLDTTTNTAYPIANKAYYKLNGNANDATGIYDATATASVSYPDGRFGKAASGFNTSQYISIPTMGLFLAKNTSSVSMWIKSSGATSPLDYIFGDYAGSSFNHLIYLTTDGKIKRQTRYSSVDSTELSSGTGFGDNNWHHVVSIVNTSNNTQQLYVDGTLADTGSIPTNSWSSLGNTEKVMIGSLWGSSQTNDLPFGGSIDQVRIFSSAISAGNVTSLYNEGTVVESTDGNDSILQFIGGSGDITFS